MHHCKPPQADTRSGGKASGALRPCGYPSARRSASTHFNPFRLPPCPPKGTPDGKLGVLMALGNPCVSRHSPACLGYAAPPLPRRLPSAAEQEKGWQVECND